MGNDRPLTWKEARLLLRKELESYLNEPAPRRSAALENVRSPRWFLPRWIQQFDVDLVVALLLSLALFVFSTLSLIAKKNDKDILARLSSFLKPQAAVEIYIAEVAAATLLLLGSLLGIWIVRRRRFLFWNDNENVKRREIRRYLRISQNIADTEPPAVLDHLSSLTGLYPVYRIYDDKPGWAKVPSLLLVPGDWIALQVGDIVPADVYLRMGNKTALVRAGERLSHATLTKQNKANLPPGRTASLGTEHLMTLCNKIQIFVVMTTPLESFLRRPFETPRSSRMNRRLHEIRVVSLVLAFGLFVLTMVVACTRRAAANEDTTLVVTNAFLASLGILPIVAPVFLFLLEIVGTARVLTTVHPFATSKRSNSDTDPSIPTSFLWLRYVVATALSRVMTRCPCFRYVVPTDFVRIPPASLNLLEKLGEATAFALIDDELVCEPHSIPQQLLIPSGKGLKLLDLFPTYDDDFDENSDHSDSVFSEEEKRQRGKSFDSDSDSDEGAPTHLFHTSLRGGARRIRRQRRLHRDDQALEAADVACSKIEVQFEDPNWWQFLPSLKSIGLACLLQNRESTDIKQSDSRSIPLDSEEQDQLVIAKEALVKNMCTERNSRQLHALAECIGLSTEANTFGAQGDVSSFAEQLRLHVLTGRLYRERLVLDVHERSSEQSRWWGLIRPDSTSVIVKDSRTQANQLLTVGDPSVVISFCNEAWQGEHATILPLAAIDRQTVLETTRNWKLADLDVAAFSYSPVPYPLETLLSEEGTRQVYLLDNLDVAGAKEKKEKGSVDEWAFVKSQVFLGVLGSAVMPRREIQRLLNVLNDAGVRFVYFSPRNMRRQKELATQIGIDVAWNAAISLRPLEKGEAEDPHRMVSSYADWDVNAKLPHGVADVRKHLEQVDNVPLLVSLFTDATKPTTKEMVEIFQTYNDTVVSVGVSHLTRNAGIFAASNVSIGIDVLEDTVDADEEPVDSSLSTELEFVSAISSGACAFRLKGASSVAHVSSMIKKGRIALASAAAATVFLITTSLSFSLFVLLSVCSPSLSMPFVPILGSAIFLLLVLPCMGLSIAMSNTDGDIMARVPEKNDESVVFSGKERWIFYKAIVAKTLFPAILPQILYLIAFGEFMIQLEPEIVASNCPDANSWVGVVRCSGIRNPSGVAWTSAGTLAFCEFCLCTIVASAGFVHRFLPLKSSKPWRKSPAWLVATSASTVTLVVTFLSTTEHDAFWSLPWYTFLLIFLSPCICLVAVEACKLAEAKYENRAEKLRRLQFETRLGAWSPR